jgi:hypothetical protein
VIELLTECPEKHKGVFKTQPRTRRGRAENSHEQMTPEPSPTLNREEVLWVEGNSCFKALT